MPSIYLLPVVANVVNAALGGMVGAQTDDEGRGMWILFSSLVELGCGLFSGMRAGRPFPSPTWPVGLIVTRKLLRERLVVVRH
jgi:hypothetical protein